jgi:peptide/nickel transport system substrate-binding protein
LVQLRTGELDMGWVLERQLAQGRALAGKHLVPYLDVAQKRIDLKQWGFLREQVVRQALDYATPKEAIFKGISKGLGAIASSDTTPLLKDYYNPNVPRHPFDLARASAMLAADGFTKGPDGVLRKGGDPLAIELWAPTSDTNAQQTNEVLQQEWGKIGIKVTLRVAGDDALFGPDGPQFTKGMAGVTDVWGNGPDPDDSYLWNSKWIPSSPAGAGGNVNAYFYPFAFQRQITRSSTRSGVLNSSWLQSSVACWACRRGRAVRGRPVSCHCAYFIR